MACQTEQAWRTSVLLSSLFMEASRSEGDLLERNTRRGTYAFPGGLVSWPR